MLRKEGEDVSDSNLDGIDFYRDAMELFYEAGHVSTLDPEFFNHSAQEFVYFDNSTDVALTKDQCYLLGLVNNISRLFTVNRCAFFSANLLSAKKYRSQIAHDFHAMIHFNVGTEASIFVFRYDEELMLSFMGYGNRCILSDWYPIVDDAGKLLEKLDIANMPISSSVDYFIGFVDTLARPYYFAYPEVFVHTLSPIDFLSRFNSDLVDRAQIDDYINLQTTAAEREYGDDYVEYDEEIRVGTKSADISADLDMMLLEMDMESDDLFGEDGDEDEDDSDDFGDEDSSEEEKLDIYEFDDVDPEIFRDPTLMVKWLNKQ